MKTSFGSFATRICPQKIARRLRAACAAKLLPLLLLTLPAMCRPKLHLHHQWRFDHHHRIRRPRRPRGDIPDKMMACGSL